MKLIQNIIRYKKTGYWKPLYRKDIIQTVINFQDYQEGLCLLFQRAFCQHKLWHVWYHNESKDMLEYIPKFTRKNAIQFGADPAMAYWWPTSGAYNYDRRRFLEWLLKEYENDTTDLRIMYYNQYKEK